tara:strand:+ start:2518 stop:3966 length:1449 start_codon:yes stop_codon:yes gene_type:complete
VSVLCVATTLFFVALFLSPLKAQAAKSDIGMASGFSSSETLTLTLGKAEILPLRANIADVLVADPSVADVVAIQSDKLYVVGAELGDTNIIALDADGNVISKIDVHVRIDTLSIQSMINQLYPDEDVKVGSTNGQIFLTGEVSTPSVAQKISRLAAATVGEIVDVDGSTDEVIENLLKVRGETQVTLRVRIMEVSRDVIRELGLSTSVNDPNEGAAPLITDTPPSSLAGLTGSLLSAPLGLTQNSTGFGRVLYDTGVDGIGFLELAINALEQENLVNILAEPNLTAVSGEEAGFLAGGEFPIPVGRDRDGQITIDYKDFGVSLNFIPIVLSQDRISLQLNTEVSSLDFGAGLALADITVPGLDVRRASTTVEMASGGSLMIAGLLRSENAKGLTGLPGIKDTPIIGDIIKSRSFQRSETEMVVMVTPYLVKPTARQANVKKRIVTERHTALSDAFADNMRQKYGDNIQNIPDGNRGYGYIID